VSRIGRLPVTIPQKVNVTIEGENLLKVKGPKGELIKKFHPNMKIAVENDQVLINRPSEEKFDKALHGLTRALIANMIEGVTNGFTKKLEIVGIGYKAEMKGKRLLVTVGYSHPILVNVPAGMAINTPTPTEIMISGIDKEMIGLVAAKIRSFRKPEPYKGKGIKYAGEQIRRKAGKTAGK
jgi:large subunit ribosomal protein L6